MTPRGTRLQRYGRAVLSLALGVLGIASVQAADIVKGGQLYNRHCAPCHGPTGVSLVPGAPNLGRAERMLQSDLTLLSVLKSGKNAMPGYAGILTDQEILDVIAYSRTLRR